MKITDFSQTAHNFVCFAIIICIAISFAKTITVHQVDHLLLLLQLVVLSWFCVVTALVSVQEEMVLV